MNRKGNDMNENCGKQTKKGKRVSEHDCRYDFIRSWYFKNDHPKNNDFNTLIYRNFASVLLNMLNSLINHSSTIQHSTFSIKFFIHPEEKKKTKKNPLFFNCFIPIPNSKSLLSTLLILFHYRKHIQLTSQKTRAPHGCMFDSENENENQNRVHEIFL